MKKINFTLLIASFITVMTVGIGFFSFSNTTFAAVSIDASSNVTKINDTTVKLKITLKNTEDGYTSLTSIPYGDSVITGIDPANTATVSSDLTVVLKNKAGAIVKPLARYKMKYLAPTQDITILFNGLEKNTIYIWMATIKKDNVSTLLDRGFVIKDTGIVEGDPASLTIDTDVLYQTIGAQDDAAQTKTDTTYTPLASLPGLETFDSNKVNAFANYFNTLIRLFIGICAVLAMVMIVVGGIEYMTSELSHSKEEGKERITHAILGLIIALGSFALLNTINPRTLDVSLLSLGQASVQEEPPTGADFDYGNAPIPSGPMKLCPEGITKPAISTAGGSFVICNRIAVKLQSMINKAWAEGYKISGWGWRSYARQVQLRIKNGCPDIYSSPPNKCRVPTAIPGTSMHESGLAVDLTCEGVGIQAHDNKCFIWLKNNAASFGFENLPSEPWHWSINGK